MWFSQGNWGGGTQPACSPCCFPNMVLFSLQLSVTLPFQGIVLLLCGLFTLIHTFFSRTSDFLVHPFLHLIRDESYSPLATSSKSVNQNHVIAMWLFWVTYFLSFIYPLGCNFLHKSPALCVCRVHLLCMTIVILHHSYIFPFQKTCSLSIPIVWKPILFFQSKFLSPQTLAW